MIVHPEATYIKPQQTAVLIVKCRTNWQKVKRSAEIFFVTVVAILGIGSFLASKADAAALTKEEGLPAIVQQDATALAAKNGPAPRWEQRKDHPRRPPKKAAWRNDHRQNKKWNKEKNDRQNHLSNPALQDGNN